MNRTMGCLRWLVNLLLVAVLVLGLVALSQSIRGGMLPSPLGEPLETLLPYPPPYPPPGGTEQAKEATPTLFHPHPELITPFLIELTPGVPVWSTGTPVPTFTPFPSPTEKPGPTSTPIPLVEPAKDASGEILYLAEQGEGIYALQSLRVDGAGKAVDEPVEKFGGLKFPEGAVCFILRMAAGWRLWTIGGAQRSWMWQPVKQMILTNFSLRLAISSTGFRTTHKF